MFRNTNLAPIVLLGDSVANHVSVIEPSLLSESIYREMTMEEHPDIESLLGFYQKDAHHEHLMDTVSTQLAQAVNGVINKVQNELLDLVDTTFEDVQESTKDIAGGIITHRLTLIPEITFFSSEISQGAEAINISSMSRQAINRANGTKFPERSSRDILHRISKYMSKDSFEKFVNMTTSLGANVEEIYNVTIRGMECEYKPLTRMGTLDMPYTYVEAVIGFYIAKSLLQEEDDEARLTETAYLEYVGTLANNMQIRYAAAVNAIETRLKDTANNVKYNLDGDIISVSLYEPIIAKMESDTTSRNDIIGRILSKCVVDEFGSTIGVPDDKRYESYRKERVNNNNLRVSSSKVHGIIVSLEKFVNSLHFDTWYSTNYEGQVTTEIRVEFLKAVRHKIKSISVSTDDDLYSAIIEIVCACFYKGRMSRFVSDIRVVMSSDDISVHDAVGIVADRLIISYLVDMLKV